MNCDLTPSEMICQLYQHIRLNGYDMGTFFDDPTYINSQSTVSVLFSRFSSQYASTPMVFIRPKLGTFKLEYLLNQIDIV